jgi:hypothetical protein
VFDSVMAIWDSKGSVGPEGGNKCARVFSVRRCEVLRVTQALRADTYEPGPLQAGGGVGDLGGLGGFELSGSVVPQDIVLQHRPRFFPFSPSRWSSSAPSCKVWILNSFSCCVLPEQNKPGAERLFRNSSFDSCLSRWSSSAPSCKAWILKSFSFSRRAYPGGAAFRAFPKLQLFAQDRLGRGGSPGSLRAPVQSVFQERPLISSRF